MKKYKNRKLPGQNHPRLAIEDELVLCGEEGPVGHQVVLLHLAGSPEELATPGDGTEEEDQVLVEQAVEGEGDRVRETAATLLTPNSGLSGWSRHGLGRRVSVLGALNWVTFREVKEGRLGILQLNGRLALITLEERGSWGCELRVQLVDCCQTVSQPLVANQ